MGRFTKIGGTQISDPTCLPCPVGFYKDSESLSSLSVDSCQPCNGTTLYADEAGLTACKTCADGFRGVAVAANGSSAGLRAAHVACDDDKCERPSQLPAHAVVVEAQCPEHGEHGGEAASECEMSCEDGYYSSAEYAPFACKPDAGSVRASYQGGAITCTQHKKCGAGSFTAVAGSNISQPICEDCHPVFTSLRHL